MANSLTIKRQLTLAGTIKKLPASKSISNRALILDALAGGRSIITNLATARDTSLMKSLLGSKHELLDAMDAGTTMRFLTAYLSITNQHKVLTGTPRMKERPIALLVDALRLIGAEINYIEKEGFPPIEICSFQANSTSRISLPGNISSQYISAMMMIGPYLPQGLTIDLVGKVGSRPYISMTQSLMRVFGVDCKLTGSVISIPHGHYNPTSITIEPDWSALSYWFAIAALADMANIHLSAVPEHSIQGDRVIVDIMDQLGVKSEFTGEGLSLTKKANSDSVTWDFSDCPDLAQTVLPVCALKNIHGEFTGLESLVIKETDRISALQNELSKVGAELNETSKGVFRLTPGHLPKHKINIETYHDHRMAMGFAPWATQMDLDIEDPDVVRKSYPEFWDDLKSIGFSIQQAGD